MTPTEDDQRGAREGPVAGCELLQHGEIGECELLEGSEGVSAHEKGR